MTGPSDPTFMRSLPGSSCTCCFAKIARGMHRMKLRASWRNEPEDICVNCWVRFMGYIAVGLGATPDFMYEQPEPFPAN